MLVGNQAARPVEGLEAILQPLTELRGIEQWQASVHDLKEDLYEVKRKAVGSVSTP